MIYRIAVALAVLSMVVAPALGDELRFEVSTKCISRYIQAATTEVWIESRSPIDITLYSNGETVEVALGVCSSNNPAYCSPYYWDHNGNGTKDQNTLDGDGTTFTRGVRGPNVVFFRAEVTDPPTAADTTVISACPVAP